MARLLLVEEVTFPTQSLWEVPRADRGPELSVWGRTANLVSEQGHAVTPVCTRACHS